MPAPSAPRKVAELLRRDAHGHLVQNVNFAEREASPERQGCKHPMG